VALDLNSPWGRGGPNCNLPFQRGICREGFGAGPDTGLQGFKKNRQSKEYGTCVPGNEKHAQSFHKSRREIRLRMAANDPLARRTAKKAENYVWSEGIGTSQKGGGEVKDGSDGRVAAESFLPPNEPAGEAEGNKWRGID